MNTIITRHARSTATLGGMKRFLALLFTVGALAAPAHALADTGDVCDALNSAGQIVSGHEIDGACAEDPAERSSWG